MTQYFAVTGGGSDLGVAACEDGDTPDPALGPLPLPNYVTWPFKTRPTDTLVVANGTLEWQDLRTLAQVQADKWASIKAQRDTHILAAGATPIGVFDTTPESMANITSVVVMLLAAPTLAAVNFTLANNSRPSIARADFLTAAQTVAAQVQGVYDQGAALRAQIDAATTIAQAQAVTW